MMTATFLLTALWFRILKEHATPVGTPWIWSSPLGTKEDRIPTHGYTATRKVAIDVQLRDIRCLQALSCARR